WLRNIRETQATHQHRQPYLRRPDTTELMPHDVYAALNCALKTRGGYRVITDVGQHQMWAAQLIEWQRPRTHITSGGAGTMGFACLAEAYGLRGFTVDRIEDASEAIRAAWDHDGSAVLDFRVEREANVFPLVPPGNSIGEMITREGAPA